MRQVFSQRIRADFLSDRACLSPADSAYFPGIEMEVAAVKSLDTRRE